jgi:hypothetical protein
MCGCARSPGFARRTSEKRSGDVKKCERREVEREREEEEGRLGTAPGAFIAA